MWQAFRDMVNFICLNTLPRLVIANRPDANIIEQGHEGAAGATKIPG